MGKRSELRFFREELTDHGPRELRKIALYLAEAGLRAADPSAALRQHVSLDGPRLLVDSREYDLRSYNNVWIVAAGKGSYALAATMEGLLGEYLSGGCVVVQDESVGGLSKVRVIVGDHPLPGERSFRAGAELLGLAEEIGSDDLVIALITGGSSALVAAPIDGISSQDKRRVHELLLRSGAEIKEVNSVRKELSAIKGGRLADAMRPKAIINLTISDVGGDCPEYICDLTVRNEGNPERAMAVLKSYDLWDDLPESVRHVLAKAPKHSLPSLVGMDIYTVVMVTGETVCAAMATEAGARGWASVRLGTNISAEATTTGAIIGGMVSESARTGMPFRGPIALLACGGESVVTLRPESRLGAGGPNQELALAAACRLLGHEDAVLLAMDTDGSDGGSDACGALVDGGTVARAESAGVGVRESLRKHESGRALVAAGDVLISGLTHTNVNDLVVAVIS